MKHRWLKLNTPSTPQESSWHKGDSISQGCIPWCKGVGQGGSPWCKGDGISQGESFGAEAYRGGSGWGNLQIWVASSWFLCYTVGLVGAPGKTGVGNRSFSQASHLLFVGTSHLSVLLVTQLQGNGSKKTPWHHIYFYDRFCNCIFVNCVSILPSMLPWLPTLQFFPFCCCTV